MSPSSVDMQQLLRICSCYGVQYDIMFNSKKSVTLIVKTKEDKKSNFPYFVLVDHVLVVVNKFRYLWTHYQR